MGLDPIVYRRVVKLHLDVNDAIWNPVQTLQKEESGKMFVAIHFIGWMSGRYIDHQGPSSNHLPLANCINSLYQFIAPVICSIVNNQINTSPTVQIT